MYYENLALPLILNTMKMKYKLKLFVFGVIILILNACSNGDDTSPKPQSTSINKILPLGASRVEGARPEYESFRYELWKRIKEKMAESDFERFWVDEIDRWIEIEEWRNKEIWDWAEIMGVTGNLVNNAGETPFSLVFLYESLLK